MNATSRKVGRFHHIYRPKGRGFEVLEFLRQPYTESHVARLCGAIERNLTDDLISPQVRRHYPDGHPAWQRPLFGHCVPASFALFCFPDTDALVPVRGVDATGEWHWWLADRHDGRILDITGCQYTEGERAEVYASGLPRGAITGAGKPPPQGCSG